MLASRGKTFHHFRVSSVTRSWRTSATLALSGALFFFAANGARGNGSSDAPGNAANGALRAARGPEGHGTRMAHADARATSSDIVAGAADSCDATPENVDFTLTEPGGPKRLFSVDGYRARALRFGAGTAAEHCVVVAWPAGSVTNDGKPSGVAARIDPAWFTLIRNTLVRVPASHARLVRRIVVDNRPTQHGIAPFDRQSPDDARDGHSIWLHEHLFVAPNHWARGNFGSYFAYHVNRNGAVVDGSPPQHDLFSPVLLHEIGHLVMYGRVNAGMQGVAAASAPACAATCGDRGDCDALGATEREAGCVSPYCMPFRFRTGTENFAEQYRFFYQGSRTRGLLATGAAGCLAVLEADNAGGAPWQRGLPDMTTFRRSVWDSCGGRACKRF